MNKRVTLNSLLLEIALLDSNSYFVFLDGVAYIHATHLRDKIDSSRIIELGIAEQNAVSFAAGLALSGKNVYLLCCAFFITTRAYEQLRDDVAYNNANVTVLGLKSGIASYASGGFSHWAVDDIALVGNLPNFWLVNCSTPKVLEHYLRESINFHGPMYLADESFRSDFLLNYPVSNGKLSCVVRGIGVDAVIIASGNALLKGLELTKIFGKKKYSISLYDAHSLAPFDNEGLMSIIALGKPIITIDEHISGGLTNIVSNIIAQSNHKVHYLPIYIQRIVPVVGDYDYVSECLLGYSSIFERIKTFVDSNSSFISLFKPFKNYIHFTNDTEYERILSVFGIKLIVARPRKNKGNHWFSYRFYLFGFIRIL